MGMISVAATKTQSSLSRRAAIPSTPICGGAKFYVGD